MLHIYNYIYVYIHTHIHTTSKLQTHTVYIYIHTCKPINSYTHAHTQMYIHTHVHTQTYIHTYYIPTNPTLASPVFATSNPSPAGPPPPFGWINSRLNLAKRALRIPR